MVWIFSFAAGLWRELQAPVSFFVESGDCGENAGRLAVRAQQGKARARPGAFSGFHENPPVIDAIFFEEENFEMAPCGFVEGAETRRNHF